jgi:hypothetical protein
MFEDEDSLPGAKCHSSAGDWDYLTCSCEGHAQVAGGIVGTFEGMNVIAVLGGDFLEEFMEIGPGAWVSILVDDEARAGVAYEHRNGAGSDTAFADDSGHVLSDLVSALTSRADGDGFVFCGHCGLIATSSQPARNNKPPTGVIAPSQRTLVIARRYSEPEKTSTPAAQIQTTVEFRLAAHSAATACTR